VCYCNISFPHRNLNLILAGTRQYLEGKDDPPSHSLLPYHTLGEKNHHTFFVSHGCDYGKLLFDFSLSLSYGPVSARVWLGPRRSGCFACYCGLSHDNMHIELQWYPIKSTLVVPIPRERRYRKVCKAGGRWAERRPAPKSRRTFCGVLFSDYLLVRLLIYLHRLHKAGCL